MFASNVHNGIKNGTRVFTTRYKKHYPPNVVNAFVEKGMLGETVFGGSAFAINNELKSRKYVPNQTLRYV